MTTVINVRDKAAVAAAEAAGTYVYIGRAMPRQRIPASIWGNPYRVGRDGTLDEVLDKYMHHIMDSPELVARLPELEGKTLACWCAPQQCHGDVLQAFIEPLPEQSAETCEGCSAPLWDDDDPDGNGMDLAAVWDHGTVFVGHHDCMELGDADTDDFEDSWCRNPDCGRYIFHYGRARRKRKYCCDTCRWRAHTVANRVDHDPIGCPRCGDVFTPSRSDQRFCSTRCRVAHHRHVTATRPDHLS